MRKGVRRDIRDKKSLRLHFKELRNRITEESWKEKSELISANFLSSSIYKSFTKICFYYPINREVDLRSALYRALDEKEVYLPRVDPVNKKLTFHRIFDLNDLTPGPFNIPEPSKDRPEIDVRLLEVILVPGIAFDLRKGRLGYGGGFYDRVLSGYRGLKVGVAFTFQIIDELPLDDHDIRMDFIITEEGIF